MATWRELGRLDWSSFGLVLGAGGFTGLAFEAGVLLGLGIDHGVELSAADHLVGTSAGSVVAALVGLGFDSRDLAALVAEAPAQYSEPAARLAPSFMTEGIPTMPHLARVLRPQRPRDMVALTHLTLHRNYRAAMLRCLREGDFDMRTHLSFLQGQAWPRRRRLGVCVTNSGSGERAVLDADTGVELVDAVLASCAVPAVMRAVPIGDHSYLDGGLVSPTSADVLSGDPRAAFTVVISPMSGTPCRTVHGVVSSRFASSRLRHEVAAFHPDQTVVMIEPAGELSRLVIDTGLSAASAKQILQETFTRASA